MKREQARSAGRSDRDGIFVHHVGEVLFVPAAPARPPHSQRRVVLPAAFICRYAGADCRSRCAPMCYFSSFCQTS